MAEDHTVIEVAELPQCNFHKDKPAYADARLPSVGGWAYVCKDCYDWHKCRTGLGNGQRLEVPA